VGTRKASDHGRAFAYRVAAELSEMGAVVVSGLATGIDAEAHKGVVDRQGVGIAVLAGGLDRVHPWANRGLARDLCERGCLLSEHPPGTSPRRGYFAGRNRLISGLSRALAVVEAGVGSGALLTAEFALEQGRPVFVMPGRPGDLRVAGSLPLLRDGANLLLSALDIAAELGLEAEGLDRAPLREVGDDGTLFAGKGASLDAMVAASGLSAPLLLARLSQLELAGRIRRGDDGLYYRV
jgi:DNA processing protein